ncbi:uncharacterized protein [Onthophagus taurus]|uniref:uncharacterized protein n=1 Tax=Onthophagus taurus TaxID=166361 RepID=UPI0039BE5B7C
MLVLIPFKREIMQGVINYLDSSLIVRLCSSKNFEAGTISNNSNNYLGDYIITNFEAECNSNNSNTCLEDYAAERIKMLTISEVNKTNEVIILFISLFGRNK